MLSERRELSGLFEACTSTLSRLSLSGTLVANPPPQAGRATVVQL
jgi:hypothetical protein